MVDHLDPPPHDVLIGELGRRRKLALAMGGEERVARHHASGRLTVRERIGRLIDEGTFFEVGQLALAERRGERPVPGDGVVTGYGEIDGRRVGLIGIDATVLAGTTAPVSMRKQGRVIEFAARKGFPIVILADADGGRIPDVMGWRFSGLPFDFSTFLQAPAGVPPVPRLAAVLGTSYGDAGLHAATAHFVVMTKSAAVALSGPSVIEASVGETVTDVELGGAGAADRVGTAHLVVDSEDAAFDAIRAALSYLPDSAAAAPREYAAVPPAVAASRILEVVPTRRRRAYNMLDLVAAIADGESILPWRQSNAPNLITALVRLDGWPAGIVANQPMQRAGVLDPEALQKELDFVELCDTFNLPLVFLQDIPGLMVGTDAEARGALVWYERVAARIAAAEVPKVAVVVRKAFGGGHYAMGGGPTNPDFLFCWPSAELGFMDAEPGIRTVHRRRLEAVEREEGAAAREALFAELLTDWADESAPWEAAAHFFVDDIIDPMDTPDVIRAAIRIAWGSRPRVAWSG